MDSKKVDNQKIAERFIFLMKYLGFENERKFGLALGYDRPDNIYNATSGQRMPGVPLLIDISNKFVNVNIGWILTGNGDMLLLKEKSGSSEPDLKLMSQIEEHAKAILQISSGNKLTGFPDVFSSEKAENPIGSSKAETSGKMKIDETPKDR